jgi:hypothetical protein
VEVAEVSDLGEDFKAMKDHYQKVRHERARTEDPTGWTQHTQWHWSRKLNGVRLDYWPSRQRFRYGGRTMSGDVHGFMRNRTHE